MREQIEETGWSVFPDITDTASLLTLAESLGKPLPNSRGQTVSELRVVQDIDARPLTLSAAFGKSTFPLHTDTAFWPVPARFLVMRASGDIRRRTTVCAFNKLIELAGEAFRKQIQQAVWTVRGVGGAHYRQISFRTTHGSSGFRYDSQCMIPANAAAREVDAFMASTSSTAVAHEICWNPDTAIVISNWQSLHGRGPEPPNEEQRILQRIYVG